MRPVIAIEADRKRGSPIEDEVGVFLTLYVVHGVQIFWHKDRRGQ